MNDYSSDFDKRVATPAVEAWRDERTVDSRTPNHVRRETVPVGRIDTHVTYQTEPHSASGRVLDMAVTLAGFLVLAAPMAVIALTICSESGRPVFFSQIRLGRSGRHFRLYKFRKFHRDAGTGGRAITSKDDPRLTRVGKVLERTKLNELPQLWNVLKGDMSMVGPRPETLNFADCFTEDYRRVLDYKPGIFGPSQVAFRDESALYPAGCAPDKFYREVLFPLKARLDLAYFPNRNVYSDIGWMVRGALAVFGGLAFRREGTSSIEELADRVGKQERRLRQHGAAGLIMMPERAPRPGAKRARSSRWRGSIEAVQPDVGAHAGLFVRPIKHNMAEPGS